MQGFHTHQSWLLFFADSIVLCAALPLALFLRYLSFPSREFMGAHIVPFTVFGIVWLLILYIADLYEHRMYVISRDMWERFLVATALALVAGLTLFYLIPQFGITPKTTLVLYVGLVALVMASVRMYLSRHIPDERKERMVCVGSGAGMDEIILYVEKTPHVPFVCAKSFSGEEAPDDIVRYVREHHGDMVVVDMTDEKLVAHISRELYTLVLEGVRVTSAAALYEDMFERISPSAMSHEWLLRHVHAENTFGYEAGKRMMDIIIAGVVFLVSVPIYPFIALAIWLDDGGPVFFIGERMGKNGVPFRLIKFRSMSTDTKGDGIEKGAKVTRVGKFLRVSRIDELPQLWNVLRGDLSLVGPRPDTVALAEAYIQELPFYPMRYIVRPGLSGWAQLYHENHSHHYIGITETEEKLTYDMYYIKHRSFLFDAAIALKTFRVLLEHKGR